MVVTKDFHPGVSPGWKLCVPGAFTLASGCEIQEIHLPESFHFFPTVLFCFVSSWRLSLSRNCQLMFLMTVALGRPVKNNPSTVGLASVVIQMVKQLPAMRETWVRSLGWEDPLEKEMATHSSILAWKIPWMEEPGRLQSMGSQRVGYD